MKKKNSTLQRLPRGGLCPSGPKLSPKGVELLSSPRLRPMLCYPPAEGYRALPAACALLAQHQPHSPPRCSSKDEAHSQGRSGARGEGGGGAAAAAAATECAGVAQGPWGRQRWRRCE